MNKKVLKVMISLVLVFLVALYVLKIFFPEQFVMCVQNEKLIAVGSYIDSHLWLRYLCAGITSFITYWLFLCASSGRMYLKWYECLYIIFFIVLIRVVSMYDVNISTAIQFSSFFILPSLTKGILKNTAIVYTFHALSQTLSLSIRNLSLYLTNINYVTVLLMGLECYFWLLLFYFYFNYKEKGGKEE